MFRGPWYGPGYHVHQGLGWGGWLLWVLFMVALWALVIIAVVWLVRSFTNRGPVTAQPWRAGGTGTVSAEQILAARFAHGQIDENEYRARLAVLRGEQVAAPAPPAAPPPPVAPPPPPPAPPTEDQG